MSATPLHVLILEDRASDVRLAVHELRRGGFDPRYTVVETEADFLAHLDPEPEIIISDFSMPQFDAMRALQLLKEKNREIPFIIVSGTIGEDSAVEALHAGAWDYLLKDRPARLAAAVKSALEQKKLIDAQRAAAQMQQQLTAILEATTDCVFMADPESYRLRYVNGNGRKMLAVKSDEDVSSMTIWHMHPERTGQIIRDVGLPTVLRDGAWSTEVAVLTRDGREIPVSLVAIAPRDESGKVRCLAAIMRDISSRQQREAELRERMKLANVVADVGRALIRNQSLGMMLQQCTESVVRYLTTATVYIWQLNAEENMLECQSRAGTHSEIDAGLAQIPVGTTRIGLIAERRRTEHSDDIRNDPEMGDLQWTTRTGMIALSGYPLLIGDELLGVMAIFTQEALGSSAREAMGALANQIALGIERKQAEERLCETYERLESLVDTSPLAIITLNRDGDVVQWNPAAKRIFGWSKTEVLNRPLPIIPGNQRVAFESMLQAEFRGQTYSSLELQRLRKNGTLVNVRLWTAPLRDSSGEIVGSLGMLADITENKQLEAQLLQAQKMEAVGRLAGGVAHDFNNLLTVITGYAEVVLANANLDPESSQFVQHIRKAGERAGGLTRQLLAFSRKQILEPQPLILNSLLEETTKMIRRLIGEDVRLECAFQPNLPLIVADPGQIEQVLINLIVNARDAMPNGGQLTIETSSVAFSETVAAQHMEMPPGSYVMLAISDNGVGMDAATKNQIFEPFFTTKEQGKGTGLGLATVYGIVKQTGGFIYVYSEIGHGTTFKIYFPILNDAEASTQKGSFEIRLPRGSETILFAEDEDQVRDLACLALRSLGYNVLEATDGREALKILEATPVIDLVVTDVVMPTVGGRELVAYAKSNRPGAKVLYLSGYTDDAIVRQGILQHDVPFLHKPFTPTTLAQKVRGVLDQQPVDAKKSS